MNMNQLNTVDLTGPALDYAVAKAMGFSVEPSEFPRIVVERSDWTGSPVLGFAPSTLWGDGGPLMEQEGIYIRGIEGGFHAWSQSSPIKTFGSSQLVAAMRALVATKLGESIEVPCALTEMPAATTHAAEPTCCPFCGGKHIVFVNTWRAASQDPTDADNVAELDEHQCRDCDNRSFWA